MWNKNDRIGGLWSIEASTKKPERLATIQSWYDTRGVLLLSYPFFRTFLANNMSKSSGETPLTSEEHALVQKQLLEGPTLVIADEAHNLKNVNSAISQTVSQIRTTSRIALTGSPLSNNLEEYFSMIDWIAPGYLGELIEFKAHFVEPIQHGTYQESTIEERRISRKTLKTLTRILDPKIHRKDITVLKGNLKPKTEFMIRVPLTDIQLEAYSAFIELFCSGHQGKTTNATLWSWVSLLGQLCSHPWLFWNRLLQDNKGSVSPSETHTDQTGVRTTLVIKTALLTLIDCEV
jgi:superfamily II DNA or RNA helicase